jgi:hypothetical protein
MNPNIIISKSIILFPNNCFIAGLNPLASFEFVLGLLISSLAEF